MNQLELTLSKADVCSHCGACLSFCNWDSFERDNPGQRGDATLCRSCMHCFRVCPRAHSATPTIEQALFGENRTNDLVGFYRAAWGAKPAVAVEGVQDAGVTTALVKFLLREKLIDGAILTRRNQAWVPESFVATTESEVESSAGTKYTASPALSILADALERFPRLALVGVPCQINALRNMQQGKDPRYDAKRVVLAIGLFCAESFTYGVAGSHGLADYVQTEMGLPLSQIRRFDIKKNNLLAFGPEQTESRPVPEIKHLAWPLCHACQDFSAELADISVGAVGSRQDENSLLARSALGLEIVERARDAGVLVFSEIRNLPLIERLAQNKRDRRAANTPEEERFLFKRSIRGNYKKEQLAAGR